MHQILVYSQTWVVITTVYFRAFPSPQRETLYPLVHIFLVLPHPSPVFCFYRFACLRTFHIKGMSYTMCLCVWLHSLSMMFTSSSMLKRVSVLHTFLLPNGIPLYGCAAFCLFVSLLMDIWVASTIPITLGFCLVTAHTLAGWHSQFPFSLPEASRRSLRVALRTRGGSTADCSPSLTLSKRERKKKKTAPTQLKSDTFFSFFSISNGIDLCSLGKSIGGVTTDYTERKEILKDSLEAAHT